MKCKNCGADYKTRELKCPYCNTENLIGKIWQVERTQAELDYENEKKKIGKVIFSPFIYDRILSRSTVILIGLYMVSFLVMVLIFMLSMLMEEIHFSMNQDKIEQQMEAYYEAGEYEKLDLYMDENYVKSQDYYTYTQATVLNWRYNQYMESRLAFQALPEEEKLTDNYYLENSIEYSLRVYKLECGIYSESDEKNQELYDKYQKEILAYWVGDLGLSKEQIEELINAKYYYDADIEGIVQDIKDRRCW